MVWVISDVSNMRKRTEIVIGTVAGILLLLLIFFTIFFPPYPTSGGLTLYDMPGYEHDAYPGVYFTASLAKIAHFLSNAISL